MVTQQALYNMQQLQLLYLVKLPVLNSVWDFDVKIFS